MAKRPHAEHTVSAVGIVMRRYMKLDRSGFDSLKRRTLFLLKNI